MVC
ncbi:hypothetical protein D021_3128A, partial [Vibrio parahaemolyticus 10296]|jgi:hypothetical protein